MTVGTLRKLSIDGIDFSLLADSDIDKKPDIVYSQLPTSGKPLTKREKQALESSGLKIAFRSKDVELQLTDLVNENSDRSFVYVNSAGAEYRCEGRFNITATSPLNGSIDITIIPNEQWV